MIRAKPAFLESRMHDWDRRHFLKTLGAGAMAAGIPSAGIPSWTFARDIVAA